VQNLRFVAPSHMESVAWCPQKCGASHFMPLPPKSSIVKLSTHTVVGLIHVLWCLFVCVYVCVCVC